MTGGDTDHYTIEDHTFASREKYTYSLHFKELALSLGSIIHLLNAHALNNNFLVDFSMSQVKD